MALGADRRRALLQVLAEGAWIALAGATVGLGGALAVAGLMRSLLFEVPPRDPATLAAAVAALLLVS